MNPAQELDREDVVLLILESHEKLLGSPVFRGVTRLEKLAYLITQLSKAADLESTFDFRPYKYGPFSAKLYDAVSFLESIELLTTSRRPNVSPFAAAEEEEMLGDPDESPASIGHERTFELTAAGRKAAAALRETWARERPNDLATIDDVVAKIGPLPLNQIIRYVYHRFPAMTGKSVHPEAKRVNPSGQ
jgi:hypothetical protein